MNIREGCEGEVVKDYRDEEGVLQVVCLLVSGGERGEEAVLIPETARRLQLARVLNTFTSLRSLYIHALSLPIILALRAITYSVRITPPHKILSYVEKLLAQRRK